MQEEKADGKQSPEGSSEGSSEASSIWSALAKAFVPLRDRPELAYGLAFGMLALGMVSAFAAGGTNRTVIFAVLGVLLLVYVGGLLAARGSGEGRGKVSNTIKIGKGAIVDATGAQKSEIGGSDASIKNKVIVGSDSEARLQGAQETTGTGTSYEPTAPVRSDESPIRRESVPQPRDHRHFHLHRSETATPHSAAPSLSPRAAMMADLTDRGGILEVVALDAGDRDFVYNRLADELSSHESTTLIRLDAADPGSADRPAEALRQTVQQIRAQLRPEAQAGLDKALRELEQSGRYPKFVYVKNKVSVGKNAEANLEGAMSTTVITPEVEFRPERLAEAAAKATQRHSGQITLLVDHAEWYTAKGPGQVWFDTYRQRINPQSVIHMLVQPSPPPPGPSADRRALPQFVDTDIQELIPVPEPRLDVAATVREVTGNRPWLIHILVADVAKDSLTNPTALRKAISSGVSGSHVWDFLSRIVFVGDRSYLGTPIARMSLMRRRDDRALKAVVEPVLPPGVDFDRFSEDLQAAHLVDVDAVPDTTIKSYRLLEPVADAARERLGQLPEESKAIHQLAADHYWNLISPPESEDEEESERQYWYRFESSVWLADCREWIHHSRRTASFSDPHSRREVRRKLTRWYLEGFFWFEMMARHHFCAELLQEWADWAQGVQEEMDWLRRFQVFHTSFGRGAFPEQDSLKPDWEAARHAIAQIREGLRPAGNTPPDAPTDESKCYAVAMHLEAETIRASGDAEGRSYAQQLYRRAYEWHVDDDWSKAWSIHDRVWLTLASEDADLVAATADIAEVAEASKPENEDDRELQTLALCRQAEIWSRSGQYDAAAQAVIAALTVVLDYQTQQEIFLDFDCDFPNEYTRQLYLEVESVATKFLKALAEAGRHDVRARMNTVTAQLFKAFDGLCDPLRGWPPPPGPDDLDHVGSDWLDRALRVKRQAENLDVLSKTTTTPLPWFPAFSGTSGPE